MFVCDANNILITPPPASFSLLSLFSEVDEDEESVSFDEEERVSVDEEEEESECFDEKPKIL